MLKLLHYECFGGDSLFTGPTFDFYFKVKLPKPRKEREIVKRDSLGRIVSLKSPSIAI